MKQQRYLFRAKIVQTLLTVVVLMVSRLHRASTLRGAKISLIPKTAARPTLDAVLTEFLRVRCVIINLHKFYKTLPLKVVNLKNSLNLNFRALTLLI